MSLEQNIMTQLKQAMKSKNEAALRTLRSIKAAILEVKTSAAGKKELSEADELKLLQKMAKQRKDALEIFKQQNRDDLAQKEAEELAILQTFLPEQMDDATLTEKLKEIIVETGASGPSDMGKVMGKAMKDLAAKAEGGAIATKVKELLSSPQK